MTITTEYRPIYTPVMMKKQKQTKGARGHAGMSPWNRGKPSRIQLPQYAEVLEEDGR